jgi:hypothetical protein
MPMTYDDNLSSDKAKEIFRTEGASWVTDPDGLSCILVSLVSKKHLAAVWNSGEFWTWRIGGMNCEAGARFQAEHYVEKFFNRPKQNDPQSRKAI